MTCGRQIFRAATFAALVLCFCAADATERVPPQSPKSKVQSPPCDLGEELAQAAAWRKDCQTFVQAHAASGFRYHDRSRKEAWCTQRDKVAFRGVKAARARAFFTAHALVRVELDFYVKGAKRIAQRMSAAACAARVEEIARAVASAELPPKTEDAAADDPAVHAYRRRWAKATPPATLEWALSGEGDAACVEWLRLVLDAPDGVLNGDDRKELKTRAERKAKRAAASKAKDRKSKANDV